MADSFTYTSHGYGAAQGEPSGEGQTAMEKNKDRPTETFHTKSKDGSKHVVGIKNLSVVISNHEGIWFAQGMEIDYAAQGDSFEGVKKAFEKGLTASVQEHLRIFGNLTKFLKPAESEAWTEFYQAKACQEYTQISLHQTEFQINYLKAAA